MGLCVQQTTLKIMLLYYEKNIYLYMCSFTFYLD